MSDTELTHTFYGRCAQVYDLVATAPGVRSWRERAAETLDLSPGDTVVEMGCGTGANFPHLRERVGASGQVVGVDLVGAMFDQARRRIDRAGWANVHAVQADATEPPVDSADAVLSTFLVGMLPSPDEAVRTWATIVESGGRITLLNAGRSERTVAVPINLGLRLFVRLTAPGSRTSVEAPVRELEGRWDSAREALFEATVGHREAQFGLGILRLASGRVPKNS
jgi:ubiquinone/menaquinone biosynthesis C-methylase UbiE